MAAFFELLTPEEVERTHEASLEVLESVGILAHNARAREYWRSTAASSTTRAAS